MNAHIEAPAVLGAWPARDWVPESHSTSYLHVLSSTWCRHTYTHTPISQVSYYKTRHQFRVDNFPRTKKCQTQLQVFFTVMCNTLPCSTEALESIPNSLPESTKSLASKKGWLTFTLDTGINCKQRKISHLTIHKLEKTVKYTLHYFVFLFWK